MCPSRSPRRSNLSHEASLDVLHGLADIEFPRAIADTHDEVRCTTVDEVDRLRCRFYDHATDIVSFGPMKGDVYERTHVAAQSRAHKAHDEALEAITVVVVQRREITVEPRNPAVICHPDEETATSVIQKPCDRARDRSFEFSIHASTITVPARSCLELDVLTLSGRQQRRHRSLELGLQEPECPFLASQ